MTLREALDMDKLEEKIKKTRHSMSGNWTTLGLKTNMQHLFDDMRAEMQIVTKESEQIRKLIRSIYQRFHKEHGFTAARAGVGRHQAIDPHLAGRGEQQGVQVPR
jgi:hypothetical protein